MGPGGPDWPGGPFKPCSPLRRSKQTKADHQYQLPSSAQLLLFVTPHSLTYSRSRDPSETLRTLPPGVTLTTYWPCLPNGTLQSTSALKQRGISARASEAATLQMMSLEEFSPCLLSCPPSPPSPASPSGPAKSRILNHVNLNVS